MQRPHPPIAIGGNGERRTLRIVAEHAQHWNSTLADVGEWQRKVEVLDRHCADVGRDPSEIERSVNVRLAAGADPRSLQPTVAGWKDAGADVCIVDLGTRTTPPSWNRSPPPSPRSADAAADRPRVSHDGDLSTVEVTMTDGGTPAAGDTVGSRLGRWFGFDHE